MIHARSWGLNVGSDTLRLVNGTQTRSFAGNSGRESFPTEFLPRTPHGFRGPPDTVFMACKAVEFCELRRRTNRMTNRPIKVLIVDDDLDARSRLHTLLLATGVDLSFREAVDGTAGVACLKDDRPDLLLLDLEMPGLDDPGVLNLLRGWPEDSRPRFVAVVSTCTTDPGLAAGVRLLGGRRRISQTVALCRCRTHPRLTERKTVTRGVVGRRNSGELAESDRSQARVYGCERGVASSGRTPAAGYVA